MKPPFKSYGPLEGGFHHRYVARMWDEDKRRANLDFITDEIEREGILKPRGVTGKLRQEYAYNLARSEQFTDPIFCVVRMSPTTGVVAFFIESGNLKPVTKELPLDEACKTADQMNGDDKWK